MKVYDAFDLPKEIVRFAHCRRCFESMPNDQSPQSWAHLDVGFTDKGFQVWCLRHDINVVTIDVSEHFDSGFNEKITDVHDEGEVTP